MDQDRFSDSRSIRAEVRQAARRILGVPDNASPEEVKRAWRHACLEHHPDRNPGDENAERRIILINCAYHVLTSDEAGRPLLESEQARHPSSAQGMYNLDNAWGLFLWWRDKFFG